MYIDTVIQRAREAGVKMVSFLYCDNAGIIRCKSTHVANLESSLAAGIGMSRSTAAVTGSDVLQAVEGKGAIGEIRLIPDPDTFTPLPYAPRWAVMLANLHTLDHQPWSLCPRSFLQRMLHQAAERGLRIQAAFEPEWTLALKDPDGHFRPCDQSLAYSSIGMMVPRPVIEEIILALEAQGLQVEQYYPELGHGQQELSIRYAEALAAADHQLLYRETVRNIAWQHGFWVSFAPKPFLDQPGNGCHIHLSVWDLAGQNLFHAAHDPANLSRTAYEFIAGLLAHLPALTALTCPSVNSYRRLQPRAWSSAFTCYGPDNREAAIRIPSLFRGQEMASTNIEIKAADASANPYLALGGLIAAGLDGLQSGALPPEGQYLDLDPAALSEEERQRRGIRRLPDTLARAAAALANDACLAGALGPDLLTAYLAVRQGEIERYAAGEAEFELREHFYRY